MSNKRCTKCGVLKNTSKFSKNRTRKDGLHSVCKACISIYGKKRYRDNIKRLKVQHKRYRDGHKKQRSKYAQEYREINKAGIAKQKKEYSQTSNGKASNRRNRQRYFQTLNGNATIRRNGQNYRARKKNLEATLTAKQWERILKTQNNRCNLCGKRFCKSRPATQDHIIPVMHNGCYTSDNIQALCKSCNSSKNANLDLHFIQVWCHNKTSVDT